MLTKELVANELVAKVMLIAALERSMAGERYSDPME